MGEQHLCRRVSREPVRSRLSSELREEEAMAERIRVRPRGINRDRKRVPDSRGGFLDINDIRRIHGGE